MQPACILQSPRKKYDGKLVCRYCLLSGVGSAFKQKEPQSIPAPNGQSIIGLEGVVVKQWLVCAIPPAQRRKNVMRKFAGRANVGEPVAHPFA